MSAKPFAANDIVIWRTGSMWSMRTEWGRVVRVTPAGTVFVVDGQGKERAFRRRGESRYAIEKPAPSLVARRMWLKKRPHGKFVYISSGLGGEDVSQIRVEDIGKSAENARAAAAELFVAAAWLEAEPKP